MPTLKYSLFKKLIQFINFAYFRNIEVYGEHFVPRDGKTLIIANHQSGLTDAGLVVATCTGVVRGVAKHILWNNWVVGFLASGLGMIPIYRKQDLVPGARTDGLPAETPLTSVNTELSAQIANIADSNNDKSFSAVESVLANRQNVLIFPEGTSHDNPHILKLRSGSARLLLQTEAKHHFNLGLKWLPVSLDYKNKDKPGSTVHIHYHPPRSLHKYRQLYLEDPETAIEALRQEMQIYLSEITINFKTWKERIFIDQLTELWLAHAPENGAEPSNLLERFSRISAKPTMHSSLNQILKWKRVFDSIHLRPEDQIEIKTLMSKVDTIHNILALSGIRASEIFHRQKEGRKRALAKLFSSTIFWAPLILTGLLFFMLPNKLISWIELKGGKGHRDVASTFIIITAIILYPAWLILHTSLVLYFSNVFFSLIFMITMISCGLSLAVAARHLKVDFIEVINMFRYKKLEDRLIFLESEIKLIWNMAAKLWNRALQRQNTIESPKL